MRWALIFIIVLTTVFLAIPPTINILHKMTSLSHSDSSHSTDADMKKRKFSHDYSQNFLQKMPVKVEFFMIKSHGPAKLRCQ